MLSSVPFVSKLRDNVLEVVSKSYNLDIYEFNNLKTLPPLTQATDLRAEIQRISKQDYESDFEFSYDLWKTINGLNDGHRTWVSCYQSAFITIQTLPLVSLTRSSSSSNSSSNSSSANMGIFIAPDAVELTAALGFTKIYKDQFKVDVSKLAGMEVTRIDGKDPWDYIDNIADTETGIYQDRNVRRSATLSSYAADGAASGNTWYRSIGALARPSFPTRDNVTYEVLLASGKKENLTVPYFSLPTVTLTTAENFFAEHCLLQSANSTSSPRVILVVKEGRLLGLVTVKDVLRHEAAVEHEQEQEISPSNWEEGRWEERVGLEGVLEEAWTFATGLFSSRRGGGGVGAFEQVPDTPGMGGEDGIRGADAVQQLPILRTLHSNTEPLSKGPRLRPL
ncbi:hypothetical protein BDY24DRAFT_443200 [Mrakia frigida]|uniref:uncharacterized protein n=1 Tax=Mrakia frigida TaxID=29902 RepID=UPI003FCC06AC